MSRSKRFDAEKFRSTMQDLLGGQYITILTDVTKASRTAINRWVDSDEAPIKGPKPEYQERIAAYLKEKIGYTIIWGDFMTSKDDIMKMIHQQISHKMWTSIYIKNFLMRKRNQYAK